MLRYAVIPTHDRPREFRDCLEAIAPQVNGVIVIAHQTDYPHEYIGAVQGLEAYAVHRYSDPVPNISTMWNIGLRAASMLAGLDPYRVAVLNDDVIVPPHWFDLISGHMDHFACVAGSSDQFDRLTYPAVNRVPGPVPLETRMTGYAFILDGSANLYADESMGWWYSDDSLEWEARRAGGHVLVPGCKVQHLYPSVSTVGVLADQAGRDRETFIAKYGKAPH